MDLKVLNRKADWIKNIKSEFQGIEEGIRTEIHVNSPKVTLKKAANRKAPGHGRYQKIYIYLPQISLTTTYKWQEFPNG